MKNVALAPAAKCGSRTRRHPARSAAAYIGAAAQLHLISTPTGHPHDREVHELVSKHQLNRIIGNCGEIPAMTAE